LCHCAMTRAARSCARDSTTLGGSVADPVWNIPKASQACCLCQAALSAGEAYYSSLFTQGETFLRRDYCVRCFQSKPPENVFYFWRATLPEAGARERSSRRRPAVDLEYVLEFFTRLGEGAGGAERDGASGQRRAFRYVLALMLARKKTLVFEGKKTGADGEEIHLFRERRGGQKHEVREPALSPEAIAAASAELGALLGVTPQAAPQAVEAGADVQKAAAITRRTTG
jgi:hypothetical protein